MSMVSSYWHYVLGELECLCRQNGYRLCFRQQEPDTTEPLEITNYRDCTGIILCGHNSRSFYCQIREKGIPVVLIGSLNSDHDNEDNLCIVTHNDRERAMISTMHLLSLGHRQIACVTVPGHSQYAFKQKAGYRDALDRYGLTPDKNIFFDVDDQECADGIKIGYDILCRRERPSAVFAGTDRSFSLGYHYCRPQTWLTCSERLVCSWLGGLQPEDIPSSTELTTTESQPRECARLGAVKLFEQIRRRQLHSLTIGAGGTSNSEYLQ